MILMKVIKIVMKMIMTLLRTLLLLIIEMDHVMIMLITIIVMARVTSLTNKYITINNVYEQYYR